MNLPSDYIEQIRAIYPKRKGGQGWTDAAKHIVKHARAGTDFETIIAGAIAYARFCDREGKTGTEFVKQACTFFGPGRWFDEDYSVPETPQEVRLKARWAALRERAVSSGFTLYSPDDPRISADVFESALRSHEASLAKPVVSLVRNLSERLK